MSLIACLKRVVRTRGDQAATAGETAASADNRGAPRLPRCSTAQLLHYPAARHQHPINVEVTDYSATGIGVIHNEGLLIGKRFVVREPHVTQRNTCIFTVVRCDRRRDGTFSIGLHVGNSLGDEHHPLLEIERAPGIARSSKILFVLFAVLGFAMILAATMMKQYGK